MTIGTFYSGTIEKFNGQCIKSKFVIIGIPLFPISSVYFVNKTQGIPLPLDGKSARIGLGRTICMVIGILLTLLCLMYDDFPSTSVKTLAIVGAILFVSITIYSWTSGQNISEDEKIKRTILEKSIGYNMLPSRLPRNTRISILQQALKKVDNKYSAYFVNVDDSTIEFDKTELPIFYSLSSYMILIKDNKPAKDFLDKYTAEKIYDLCFKNNAKI